jgi:uncharacterized protein YegP (UPF0339 family)
VCLIVATCIGAPGASAAAPTLTASPSAVVAGGSVSVSWNGVVSPAATDWVGLYRQGAADTALLWWFYTSTCSSAVGAAEASGSCSLNFPAGAGTYEFRLFANNGYTRLATSGPVVVGSSSAPPPGSPTLTATPASVPAGGMVSVAWDGVTAPTATDWVGLYRQGAADDASVRWFYTSTCLGSAGTAKASGSCSLAMPSTEGTYELRLFAQNGWTRIAVSGPIEVGGSGSTGSGGTGSGDPVLLAAGDQHASCSSDGDEQTAAIVARYPGASVAALGDLAGASSTTAEWPCYDASWGAFKARTRPALGDHEYDVSPTPYFSYWASAAGDPGKGYYSYDLGAWHVVVLNANCDSIGGCEAGSPQEQWLRQDLAAHARPCTLAYWEEPLFASSSNLLDTSVRPLWRALYAYGADVVLNAHARQYERFAPQTPDGARDDAHGIREFIVGTGGAAVYSSGPVAPNSDALETTTLGVLKLSLHATSYDWQFLPVDGQTFADSGTAECNVPDTSAPTVSLVAPAAASTVSGTVQLTASASDDAGVAKVDFLVNGAVVATDTTAPYAANWSSTSVANGSVQLAARATDTAGNVTTSAAVTATVQNEAPAVPTLTVTPSSVVTGGSVTVSWSGIASPTGTDWVGIFSQGAGNGSYLRWFYTATCTSSSGAAKASGACPVTMPTTAGTYELRLFANNGYTVLATSGPVVVGESSPSPSATATTLTATPSATSKGGTVTVSWDAVTAPTGTDWVGLFRQGAPDSALVWWFYTSTCSSKAGSAKASGSCSLSMPKTAGTYELRLFANNGYTRIAVSSAVVVS